MSLLEECIMAFLVVCWIIIFGMLWHYLIIEKMCPPTVPNGRDKYRGWEGWEL